MSEPSQSTPAGARFLLDDLAWLQQQLADMATPATRRDRDRLTYYEQLARARRRQLKSLCRHDPLRWKEYLLR